MHPGWFMSLVGWQVAGTADLDAIVMGPAVADIWTSVSRKDHCYVRCSL